MFRAVAAGEKPYGMMVDFVPIREAQAGSPVAVVYPDEGVPAITEPGGHRQGHAEQGGGGGVCGLFTPQKRAKRSPPRWATCRCETTSRPRGLSEFK